MEKSLISYFKTLGITINTCTKARGHYGFFLNNRIDISKNTPKDKVINVLLHEFSHYIHNKIEPDISKTGGTLEKLFCIEDTKIIEEELLKVTHEVDENSKYQILLRHKEFAKSRIKYYEQQIKKEYPNFLRSKKFKDFEKYIKHSKAKFLMKYDRVKYVTPFLRRVEYYSINNIEKDFKDIKPSFAAYIRLHSFQKKQARISSKINRLNKYYKRPTELFSRLVESLYMDKIKTQNLAPKATERFFELLNNGYYFELKNVFEMTNII